MNIAGVERFDLRASGGADNVVVNDLTGAGLSQLNADLANDGAADVTTSRARRLQTAIPLRVLRCGERRVESSRPHYLRR
jgi:hypothetical protein